MKSLRAKLILFTTVLIIVVMFTITYFFTYREIQSRLNDVEAQMQRIAQNIGTMQLLDRQEWEIYQNYISQLMAFNKDIVYIALYDARGNLRAHTLNTDWLDLDKPVTSRRRQAEIIRQLDSGSISAESVDDLRTQMVNIQIGERVLGNVNVGFSVIEINDRLREHVYYVIILSIFFLLVFISVSVYLSRKLTRPLEKLTRAMRRINEGYLDQRVEAQTKDEIGQLSGSFNMMVAGLKERQIIDDLGRDLSSTFQFNKLASLVRDSLRNAIGAKNVRLYVHDQNQINTYHEITNPDSEFNNYPPIKLSETGKNFIISDTSGFMIHDSTKNLLKELNHSPDDEPGLVLPMLVKDQLFGMLFFALPNVKDSFSEKERRFAATLAAQATLALENAMLYDRLREQERIKRELEIAREVQQQLLPSKMPELEGYSIEGICRSAFEVGGDYFDFFPLENNNLGIVIADVSGKGTSASFYMAELKGLMMQLSSAIQSPKALLIDLNQKLLGNIDRQSFISMIYGIIDPQRKKFTFARAGHNALLKLGQNGDYSFLTPGGIGLGLAADDKFINNLDESSISIMKGDLLIFYTDGITEAMNEYNEEYGEGRLLEVSLMSKKKKVSDIRTDILNSVDEFLGSCQAHDDQTMIIVKCIK
jgi:serine phosphatase RsbU (regulator of sigma subunit)/HAMP domain-containing protein